MKVFLKAISLVSVLLAIASLATNKPNTAAELSKSVSFTGRYIMAISDSDFLASTYSDNKLPQTDSNITDKLSLIKLPLDQTGKPNAQIGISNSVTSPPFIMSVSPNGKTAFVVETLGATPEGATLRKQLPSGRKLVAVDLVNPLKPNITDSIEIAPNPESVDINPHKNLIAITTSTPGKEVIIVPVQNGKFGKPKDFSLQSLGLNPDPNYFQNGMVANYVEWHPSGRYLAVNLHYRDRVAFYELKSNRTNTNINLVRWGDLVQVGKDPYSGQFTPDGRFFITTNWGRNFGTNITTLEQRLPKERGTLSVIRVAGVGTSLRTRHQVVSQATTDISPEGISISPDGSLIVTVNMRGTLFPKTSERFTQQASLSLLTLNRDSGQLTKVDDYRFEGILPESAMFDASGKHLAVTVFDYFTPKPEGGVEIWQVVREPSLALERTGQIIDVGRGVHQVVVVH